MEKQVEQFLIETVADRRLVNNMEDGLKNEMLDFGSRVPMQLKEVIETDGDAISMPDEFL